MFNKSKTLIASMMAVCTLALFTNAADAHGWHGGWGGYHGGWGGYHGGWGYGWHPHYGGFALGTALGASLGFLGGYASRPYISPYAYPGYNPYYAAPAYSPYYPPVNVYERPY